MVRNLLAITRIDAGALELRLDWIDLKDIVGRVAGAARRRGAPQTLVIGLPADLPLVRADATLIEQAVGNLIANAVAHTPSQTRVVVTASVTPEQVAIHVVDDGPGIAPDALPRIFDKFVKARGDSETDGEQGTGLGLAISKGIMEAHGGTIAAESPVASGHGTRMTLSFARKEPA
jgi:two-component system sensor histidine kinase KdpD